MRKASFLLFICALFQCLAGDIVLSPSYLVLQVDSKNRSALTSPSRASYARFIFNLSEVFAAEALLIYGHHAASQARMFPFKAE